jgi:hypothetical protein
MPQCTTSVTPTQEPLIVNLGVNAETAFHQYDIEWTPAASHHFRQRRAPPDMDDVQFFDERPPDCAPHDLGVIVGREGRAASDRLGSDERGGRLDQGLRLATVTYPPANSIQRPPSR